MPFRRHGRTQSPGVQTPTSWRAVDRVRGHDLCGRPQETGDGGGGGDDGGGGGGGGDGGGCGGVKLQSWRH